MELDMEIGEGQPLDCPLGDRGDDFGESTLPVSVQPQTLGFSGRFL